MKVSSKTSVDEIFTQTQQEKEEKVTMENKSKKCVWFLAVMCCVMTLSKISSACFIPRICQSQQNSRAYDIGYLKGENIVNSAWNGIDQDCAEIEGCDGFKKTVLDAVSILSLPEGASEFVICHYFGYVQGAIERLKEIEDSCRFYCVMDDQMVGHIAAVMYCELSIAFHGLDLDDDFVEGIFYICHESMVEPCKSTFEMSTTFYVNFFGRHCAPYTQNEYVPVWEQARDNHCFYHP